MIVAAGLTRTFPMPAGPVHALRDVSLTIAAGDYLAVPLGVVLSLWLDRILKAMPGIPAALHFFVFEPRALVFYVALLATASIAAAAYPMRIVSALPIAATLRREVIS